MVSTFWFEFSVFKWVFSTSVVKQITWALRQLRARDTYSGEFKTAFRGRQVHICIKRHAASKHVQYSVSATQGCVFRDAFVLLSFKWLKPLVCEHSS